MNSKVTPILIGLLVIAAFVVGVLFTRIQYLEKKQAEPLTTQANQSPQPAATPKLPTTIGNFSVTENEICQENGKPIVYYFGASSCPHCQWEYPIMKKVAAKFTGQISFHDNMDKQDADQEIWTKFSDINSGGYIPFIILGCKYARVGSGENTGEQVEEDNLTALICQITNNLPEAVCSSVKDLTK
jgi:thiol-disulfide isomerase/thioredoxin